MELEKLFKCGECDAKFVNADLLQVHQRRHEMSLNLSLKPTSSSSLLTPSILTKGSLSAGIIGFVDETPTPTRFIRNCEEVGLFQDLQNVNPFDEDFKKAANSAAATPSGEGTAFDFSFAGSVVAPGTPACLKNVASRSKRRYSDQDSLNTPQVFPYLNISSGGYHLRDLTTSSTAAPSSSLTPTQLSVISQESLRSVLQIETPTTPTPTTTYNHEEHVSIIAYTSAISQQANKNDSSCGRSGSGAIATIASNVVKSTGKEKSPSVDFTIKSPIISSPITPTTFSSCISHSGSRISLLKIRSKSNLKLDLKLDLKPTTSRNIIKTISERDKISPRGDRTPGSSAIVDREVPDKGEKLEILERKRAAAHRSRERRKQWIYGLESRCRTLEALLAQSQSEVDLLKSENESLRIQLQAQEKDKPPKNVKLTPATTKCSKEGIEDAPTFFVHQSCQTDISNISSNIQESRTDVKASSSGSSTDLLATIVSPLVLPTVKAKRGRPKKGQERRVPIVSVPISSSNGLKTIPKIPILPLSNNRQLPVLKNP